MNKNDIKYFQYEIRIEEEVVLERFKEFLNNVNLRYVYVYNPISQDWKVFIDVEGEIMKKAVESAIKLFVEVERNIKGVWILWKKSVVT